MNRMSVTVLSNKQIFVPSVRNGMSNNHAFFFAGKFLKWRTENVDAFLNNLTNLGASLILTDFGVPDFARYEWIFKT